MMFFKHRNNRSENNQPRRQRIYKRYMAKLIWKEQVVPDLGSGEVSVVPIGAASGSSDHPPAPRNTRKTIESEADLQPGNELTVPVRSPDRNATGSTAACTNEQSPRVEEIEKAENDTSLTRKSSPSFSAQALDATGIHDENSSSPTSEADSDDGSEFDIWNPEDDAAKNSFLARLGAVRVETRADVERMSVVKKPAMTPVEKVKYPASGEIKAGVESEGMVVHCNSGTEKKSEPGQKRRSSVLGALRSVREKVDKLFVNTENLDNDVEEDRIVKPETEQVSKRKDSEEKSTEAKGTNSPSIPKRRSTVRSASQEREKQQWESHYGDPSAGAFTMPRSVQQQCIRHSTSVKTSTDKEAKLAIGQWLSQTDACGFSENESIDSRATDQFPDIEPPAVSLPKDNYAGYKLGEGETDTMSLESRSPLHRSPSPRTFVNENGCGKEGKRRTPPKVTPRRNDTRAQTMPDRVQTTDNSWTKKVQLARAKTAGGSDASLQHAMQKTPSSPIADSPRANHFSRPVLDDHRRARRSSKEMGPASPTNLRNLQNAVEKRETKPLARSWGKDNIRHSGSMTYNGVGGHIQQAHPKKSDSPQQPAGKIGNFWKDLVGGNFHIDKSQPIETRMNTPNRMNHSLNDHQPKILLNNEPMWDKCLREGRHREMIAPEHSSDDNSEPYYFHAGTTSNDSSSDEAHFSSSDDELSADVTMHKGIHLPSNSDRLVTVFTKHVAPTEGCHSMPMGGGMESLEGSGPKPPRINNDASSVPNILVGSTTTPRRRKTLSGPSFGILRKPSVRPASALPSPRGSYAMQPLSSSTPSHVRKSKFTYPGPGRLSFGVGNKSDILKNRMRNHSRQVDVKSSAVAALDSHRNMRALLDSRNQSGSLSVPDAQLSRSDGAVVRVSPRQRITMLPKSLSLPVQDSTFDRVSDNVSPRSARSDMSRQQTPREENKDELLTPLMARKRVTNSLKGSLLSFGKVSSPSDESSDAESVKPEKPCGHESTGGSSTLKENIVAKGRKMSMVASSFKKRASIYGSLQQNPLVGESNSIKTENRIMKLTHEFSATNMINGADAFGFGSSRRGSRALSQTSSSRRHSKASLARSPRGDGNSSKYGSRRQSKVQFGSRRPSCSSRRQSRAHGGLGLPSSFEDSDLQALLEKRVSEINNFVVYDNPLERVDDDDNDTIPESNEIVGPLQELKVEVGQSDFNLSELLMPKMPLGVGSAMHLGNNARRRKFQSARLASAESIRTNTNLSDINSEAMFITTPLSQSRLSSVDFNVNSSDCASDLTQLTSILRTDSIFSAKGTLSVPGSEQARASVLSNPEVFDYEVPASKRESENVLNDEHTPEPLVASYKLGFQDALLSASSLLDQDSDADSYAAGPEPRRVMLMRFELPKKTQTLHSLGVDLGLGCSIFIKIPQVPCRAKPYSPVNNPLSKGYFDILLKVYTDSDADGAFSLSEQLAEIEVGESVEVVIPLHGGCTRTRNRALDRFSKRKNGKPCQANRNPLGLPPRFNNSRPWLNPRGRAKVVNGLNEEEKREQEANYDRAWAMNGRPLYELKEFVKRRKTTGAKFSIGMVAMGISIGETLTKAVSEIVENQHCLKDEPQEVQKKVRVLWASRSWAEVFDLERFGCCLVTDPVTKEKKRVRVKVLDARCLGSTHLAPDAMGPSPDEESSDECDLVVELIHILSQEVSGLFCDFAEEDPRSKCLLGTINADVLSKVFFERNSAGEFFVGSVLEGNCLFDVTGAEDMKRQIWSMLTQLLEEYRIEEIERYGENEVKLKSFSPPQRSADRKSGRICSKFPSCAPLNAKCDKVKTNGKRFYRICHSWSRKTLLGINRPTSADTFALFREKFHCGLAISPLWKLSEEARMIENAKRSSS